MLETGKLGSTANQAQVISHMQNSMRKDGKIDCETQKVGDKRQRMNATFATQVFNEYQELKKKRAEMSESGSS